MPRKVIEKFQHFHFSTFFSKNRCYHQYTPLLDDTIGGFYRTRLLLHERNILVGYNLEVVESLPFDHFWATCTNMANSKIFLCFNRKSSLDWKKCRWTGDQLGDFTQTTLSSYNHDRGSRISSSESKLQRYAVFYTHVGDILAVGSYYDPQNTKAEIYNDQSDSWTSVPDYPYSGEEAFSYVLFDETFNSEFQLY